MPAAIPAILAITAIAGTALSVTGAMASSRAASSQASYQQQQAADQQRQEQLRQQDMELRNRRAQLEAVRQGQKARSMALAAATNQGAQFGSGLPGGYGQISGDENTNLLGLNQSLDLGRQNFAISQDITSARMGYASASGAAALGAGYSSLGGALIQAMGPIGRLSGGFGDSAYGGYSSKPTSSYQDDY